MSPHISRRYGRMVAPESPDDQQSARVFLLDPIHPAQAPPRQPRRLQKPYPRPVSPTAPAFAPRPVALPTPVDRQRSGMWPLESSHHNSHQRAKSVPMMEEMGIAIKAESSRPWLRSNGIASRDGKLVKAMGPGEPRPVAAVALPEDDDEDDEEVGASWGRKRLRRLKELLREKM